MTSGKLVTLASLLGSGLALAGGCASTSTVFSLSSSDKLDTWRAASSSQKAGHCENLSSWLSEPVSNPSGLCSCISTTADDGGYDIMTVLEVAKVCSALLKEN